MIGIPFYVWDLADRFHEDVVEDFIDEYAAGRTPNPCLRCNEKIKFAAVLDRALALGFDAVATGHYAQLRTGADGLIEMHRAVDHGKDQSYVLGVLDQRPARALALPARRLAPSPTCARRRPRAACWSPTSPTATTSASSPTATPRAGCARSSATRRPTTAARSSTRRRRGARPPRRHLRLHDRPAQGAAARPAGAGRQAAVRARHRAGLRHRHRRPARARWPSHRLSGIRPRWCGTVPTAAGRHGPAARARRRAPRAWSRSTDDGVEIELLEPAYGIAPGQAAVIYDGTRVVGSATIAATRGPHRMTLATGVGSMPGDDQRLRRGRPPRPRRAARPAAPAGAARAAARPPSMIGRGLAVMAELGADLQPAGLAAHRRARASTTAARAACSRQDLDALEELTEGYAGAFKIQVAGPWTLAATVEKPRGDKVLSDFGARRELAQALAEGVRGHVADVRRRLPGVDRLVVQVDEPALAAVLGGAGADGVRLRPAPDGAPAGGLRGAGVGARRGHRRGRGAVGAHLRVRHAAARCCGRRVPAGSRSTSG